MNADFLATTETVKPLSVTEFVNQINEVLVEQVAWVEGEVCDLRISQGKWMHFSIKDDNSLVNCFTMAFRVKTPIEDGMKVRVWGIPKIYPKFGKFSINVEIVEPSGEGALKRAFELLKQKLISEGLFAVERKRTLPRFPEKIGLITSSEAAAYTDFLKVLKARRGGIEIYFINVTVQGKDAPKEICAAIEQMNEVHSDLDALVLVRGGGSLEDLHAFNDEAVVRTLARSRIPTVTGVGHERDVTLVDFVADLRASTPSNVAELLTPTRVEIKSSVNELVNRLSAFVRDDLSNKERGVVRSVNILRESVIGSVERIQFIAEKMSQVGRLYSLALERNISLVLNYRRFLDDSLNTSLARFGERLDADLRVLNSLHPVNTLARGFSITKTQDGKILKNAKEAEDGSIIETVLHHGTINSIINSKKIWQRNQPSISQSHTKSSKKSSRSSRQATLI